MSVQCHPRRLGSGANENVALIMMGTMQTAAEMPGAAINYMNRLDGLISILVPIALADGKME